RGFCWLEPVGRTNQTDCMAGYIVQIL
ncbi:hypothetical protein ALC62_09905, partial [Cyphomyrmex costatus]